MGGDAMRVGRRSSTAARASLWTKLWSTWGRRGASLWTTGARPWGRPWGRPPVPPLTCEDVVPCLWTKTPARTFLRSGRRGEPGGARSYALVHGRSRSHRRRARGRGAPQRTAAPHRQRLPRGLAHDRAAAGPDVQGRGSPLGDHDGRAPRPVRPPTQAVRHAAAGQGRAAVAHLPRRTRRSRRRFAGSTTSTAAGGPARRSTPRSGCPGASTACRASSSTTCCCTSSPTCWLLGTGRTSGPSSRATRELERARGYLDGFSTAASLGLSDDAPAAADLGASAGSDPDD